MKQISKVYYGCTHWMRPRNAPPPAFELIYEGAIGQPRQTTSLCDPLEEDVVESQWGYRGTQCTPWSNSP